VNRRQTCGLLLCLPEIILMLISLVAGFQIGIVGWISVTFGLVGGAYLLITGVRK
jgi:hypothetical protein